MSPHLSSRGKTASSRHEILAIVENASPLTSSSFLSSKSNVSDSNSLQSTSSSPNNATIPDLATSISTSQVPDSVTSSNATVSLGAEFPATLTATLSAQPVKQTAPSSIDVQGSQPTAYPSISLLHVAVPISTPADSSLPVLSTHTSSLTSSSDVLSSTSSAVISSILPYTSDLALNSIPANSQDANYGMTMEGVNAGLQQHPGDMDSSSGPAGGPPGGLLHNSGLLIGIGVALVAIFFSLVIIGHLLMRGQRRVNKARRAAKAISALDFGNFEAKLSAELYERDYPRGSASAFEHQLASDRTRSIGKLDVPGRTSPFEPSEYDDDESCTEEFSIESVDRRYTSSSPARISMRN